MREHEARVELRIRGERRLVGGREIDLQQPGRVRAHTRDEPHPPVVRGESCDTTERLVGALVAQQAPRRARAVAHADVGTPIRLGRLGVPTSACATGWEYRHPRARPRMSVLPSGWDAWATRTWNTWSRRPSRM